MAIAAYFHPKNMTLTQFNEIHRRLEKAGAEPDRHRLHHSCFGEDGNLMVYDVWDSPQSLQAFGEVLMPILAEVGVDPGEPAVMPIHKLDQAAASE
ncbi:MAG TPA: hypothetical protein VH594_27175 [Trebonia sp.]|jgi:hypothetical protein